MQPRISRAIILKKIPYGEADLIVTFFGREEGRLAGIAKNARVSQRRFGGALQLGSIVDLRYVHRLGADLVRVEDAHIATPVTGLMHSLDRISAMSRALALALAFLPEHQASVKKFDLLTKYITEISQNDPTPSSAISFELNWLALVGYRPMLDACMNCGTNVHEVSWFFALDRGGVFCHNCTGHGAEGVKLGNDVVQKMRVLANGPDVELSKSEGSSLRMLLSSYVEHILGHPLAGRIIV